MSEEIRGLNEEALARIVAAAVKAATQNDPLREKQLQEELAQEERRRKMMVTLGKIEEEAMTRKKNGCTHCRLPMSAGKYGGYPAVKGQGEWTTSGQMHSDGTATMVCLRCAWTWHWQPTNQEREYIEQQGMLNMAPPDESRLIKVETEVA